MACTQTLAGIPKDCSTSKGGIVEVYIADRSGVGDITLAEEMITSIAMSESAKFKRYSFPKGTGSMTSTLNVDPANGVNFVSTDLVLNFSRMDTQKRIEMNALAVGDLAVIVKDANGKYWYLGYDEPVNSTAGGGETGTARTDANKYTTTLNDVSDAYPYEVSPEALKDIVD